MTAHIVAMGGGGFATSPLGSPTNFDRYVVELTGKRSPLVCFVPTASADDPQYINRFLVAYGTLGIRPMVLTLWQDAANAVARIAEADLILVGNGATVNALALWKAHGVGKAIKQRYAQGDVVLAGTAAGANVWFEGCVTDSFGDFRPFRGGLGLVQGSFCSHFDSEDSRVGVFTDAVSAGDLPGGWAADDGAGVHFTDGSYTESVSESAGQRVFGIHPSDLPTSSGVVVEQLPVRVL
ncbi:MAG TPA: Type 1 glutamine amidotransferase-like domain-containing protein [Propioniciclava sp.]|jgi:dipeptidase E|uniref:Type 1 glutamine amidotransferase-like domain-containing protein n=1 Tax=Propioniciclava sp. TaxID=2038686 RepID=UPI002C9C3F54|nr:Type 1 glutamine amidotransferase-like domain-containing protein [Propioniciclava sp.]HRL49444.1 Type 1 glutamine amidotransferase-like domain-containing protein [Propioniciclava sp.]HRL79254.1 Type 1 glutamine amidotransferase-like domain-containing protein [Propioniciclava sp.]